MRRLTSFLFLIALFSQTFAFAGLGEREDAIEKDRQALKLEKVDLKQSSHPGFNVHEMKHQSLNVKEYVNSQGIVFGVTWRGNTLPDLAPLLGPYFNEYQEALKNHKRTPGRRRTATISGKHVTVESSGTMRAMQGRAYIPTLIPAGASLNDIQ